MLDVRPTAYLNPIAEQEFASLSPLIRVVNAGDEAATVTGLVRIYRVSTGLLIYSSELAVTELAAGETADIAALTPWSPPAPADDDYQIVVNTSATSHPPAEWHQLTASLGAFTFDIKPVGMGPAPAAHAVTHENGGSDPLEVETLPTSELDDTLVLAPDGAGGLQFVAPAVGGNIEALPTAEMDDTLVLAPDGAGGVEFRAEAGGIDSATFELFVANGTWTKPAGAKLVYVECIGAGAGGSGAHGNAAGTGRAGGTGGGAGAFARGMFPANALSATETVTIGAGSAGSAGGTNADGTDQSTPGGNSSFGAHLTGYGGGGAKRGRSGSASEGGGGGGTGSAGVFSGAGGSPGAATSTAIGGQGGQGTYNADAGCAEYGGAGGAGNNSITLCYKGGSSIYGPGGGGSGGYVSSANVEGAGKDGGKSGSYTAGGGGTAGAVDGGAGGNGAAGDGYKTCGSGGGGGGGQDNGTGGVGGNGGAPGGGGGGGGAGTNTGGAGGNGGRGEVRVWVWF